jgi:hypothetical protein
VFFAAMNRYLKQKSVKDKHQFILVKATQEPLFCCQILVVLADSGINIADVLAQVARLPILTISNVTNFAAKGGHINFFHQHSKLRFEVNWQATMTSNLKVSSRLLSLAKVINKPRAID